MTATARFRVPDWLPAAAPWLGIALCTALAGWVADRSLRERIATTRVAITALEQDLKYLETASAEMARLATRASAHPRAPAGGVLVALERSAAQAEIRDTIVSLSAAPSDGAAAVFEEVAFAAWLEWVQLLYQTDGLSVRSATLDAGQPGRANGQVTFGGLPTVSVAASNGVADDRTTSGGDKRSSPPGGQGTE